jgi:hypothetical protein
MKNANYSILIGWLGNVYNARDLFYRIIGTLVAGPSSDGYYLCQVGGEIVSFPREQVKLQRIKAGPYEEG